MSTVKGEFLEWIAFLQSQPTDPAVIRGIDEILDRGLEMYDEGYLAATCDRDHAIMEDLQNLVVKYSWG